MSENSLPRAADHDKLTAQFIEDLRVMGRHNTADAYQLWFDWNVLYIDTSGRIVEVGAPPAT
jgi:hypothetical protein